MKIIAGHFKNRKIPTVKAATYRPSTGKFKEALFSILLSCDYVDIENARILDLFSGSGQLSFEALSRGAKFAHLIDIESKYLESSKRFAEQLCISDKVTVQTQDIKNIGINRNYGFDLVFMDPPYCQNYVSGILPKLIDNEWLVNNAIIAIDVDKEEVVNLPENVILFKERLYGRSKLQILQYRVK